MGRSPCCDKNGLKKGPWTQEEDLKLMEYIEVHGPGSWRTLPKNAGLQRCGKSCRLRWTNYLRPDIKRGRFSFEEEETIIQLHSVLGNKWSAIAARLPGRTDNEIKNYWNTHIRKRLLRMGIDPVTHSPRLDLLDLSSLLNSHHHQLNLSSLLGLQTLVVNPELLRLATTLMAAASTNNVNENQEMLFHKLQENQILSGELLKQNDQDQDQDNHHQNMNMNMNMNAAAANNNQVMFKNDPPAQENVSGCSSSYLNNDQSTTTSTTTAQEQFQMNADDYFQEMLLMASNANLLSPPVLEQNLYGGGYHDGIFSDRIPNNDIVSETCHQNYMHNNIGSTTSVSPLNSSSTNLINSSSSTTEDERESYCSSIMKFVIPASLDFDDFM